ncbi:hypothetical protein B0H13DRAFT_1178165 [Mycena leptocephala]|nr:hypothetical protein B0H13DRAFT_1178165 [Mycena leptocephala]
MDCSIDTLPDEVLAVILKLAADSPVLAWLRKPPFPVTVSRVSRRWRVVTLASPELWTTIRLSHRSRSWSWATVFAKRSGSSPLDISINLEAYALNKDSEHGYEHRHGYELPVSIHKALAIVGPHIGRWRTFALRCWEHQVEQLREFLEFSPGAASQLQSAHISLVNWRYWEELPPLPQLFGIPSLRSFRANCRLDLVDFTAFRAVQSLDIDCGDLSWHLHTLRPILGPWSPLRTLIIRNFYPQLTPLADPIEASTIQSLAVSFSRPFFYRRYYEADMLGGFETFTNTFSFPSLEYLEIVGGFTGGIAADRNTTVPEEWEAPLFPHLHTLRLEDVGFGRKGLTFIQSLSRGITALQLIYTTGNQFLLQEHGGDAPWPALRALTVETQTQDISTVTPEWLALFIAKRASLGPHGRILELTLPSWPEGVSLTVQSPPRVRRLCDGPSPALMDGFPGYGFYVDEYDMRAKDFEHVETPERRSCSCYWTWYEDLLDWEVEVNKEIAEAFEMSGELVRTKGVLKELKKKRRRNWKVDRRLNVERRSSRRQRCDITEDFYFT